MEITEIRVFPVEEDKLKAYASIVLDDCFIVNDLKVIAGKKGLFISMPSRRRKRGGYRDVAHPLNNETRDLIERRVIAEYRRSVSEEVPERRTLDDDEIPPAEEAPSRPSSAPPPEPEPDDSDAPPLAARSAEPDPASRAVDEPEPSRPSLEEVEERHLRDSFWSVS